MNVVPLFVFVLLRDKLKGFPPAWQRLFHCKFSTRSHHRIQANLQLGGFLLLASEPESTGTTKQTGTRSQIPRFSNSGKTKQDREHQAHKSLGCSLCLEHMGETFHSAHEWNNGLISKLAPHLMHGHTPDASILPVRVETFSSQFVLIQVQLWFNYYSPGFLVSK